MHEVDERVREDDIRGLASIYRRILSDYFAA
jgi:acetylornithine deacetylase/succinyl-diaminopimelate desuccinylase-like protein